MLSHKQLLLVLDNCEHVLGSVARLVARIERKCPGVAVLATSREGMAIDGEQVIAFRRWGPVTLATISSGSSTPTPSVCSWSELVRARPTSR